MNIGEQGFEVISEYCEGRVLIRTDAEVRRGLCTGHIMRSLTIADFLRSCGHDIQFIIPDHVLAQSILDNARVSYSFFPEGDYDKERECLSSENGDTLIVDYPNALPELIHYQKHRRMILIDDHGNGVVDQRVDLVLNASLSRQHHRYILAGTATQLCCGGEYFFPSRKLQELKKNGIDREKANEIVLFMGGVDPYNYTEAVLLLCKNLPYYIHVIVGKGNQRGDVLRSYANDRIVLHIAPPSVELLFAHCCLAVVTGGLVSMEAAYLGIPVVVMPTIKHEKDNRRALYKYYHPEMSEDIKDVWNYLDKETRPLWQRVLSGNLSFGKSILQ